MALPKTYTSKIISQHQSGAGFTLMEVLVVIGLITMIAGFTAFMGLDTYRGYGFRNERDTIIAVLQKARSQAMSNICKGSACDGGEPHGVHFDAGAYVVFQGTSYNPGASTNESVIANNTGLSLTTVSDIIFTQLSGTASVTPWTITLSDPYGHSSDVTVNAEGQIAWSN